MLNWEIERASRERMNTVPLQLKLSRLCVIILPFVKDEIGFSC